MRGRIISGALGCAGLLVLTLVSPAAVLTAGGVLLVVASAAHITRSQKTPAF